MKRTITFLAAAAAALCTMSCNKTLDNTVPELPTAEENGDRVEITVGLGSTITTKSTTVTDEDQEEVRQLQIFVFRGDALDAYTKVMGAKEATLSCTAGEREIYALVNDVDRSTISTKTQLLAAVSDFTNPFVNKFAMIGSVTKTLPQAEKISIDVKRLNSRIVLKKITNNITAPALATLDFRVVSIYLLNAPEDINLGLTAAPTSWKHKQQREDVVSPYNYEDPNHLIAHDDYWTDNHTFFCYPNPTVEDSQATEWCPRHTRLVIQAQIGNTTYYYPITLPILEPNKSYEITNVTITRPGSDNPDKPVSFSDCTFDINILPWNVVPVTEGLTI